MGTCLLDVTSHDLLVFIMRKLDLETICATAGVSAEFCRAARQSLRLIHSVSIHGTDTNRKLHMIRTINRHCKNVRRISAHFVDDLPREEIARVFTKCRKLRSFRRVPPGVLRLLQVTPLCRRTASGSLELSSIPSPVPMSDVSSESGSISSLNDGVVPSSGDDVVMSPAPVHSSSSVESIASSAPSISFSCSQRMSLVQCANGAVDPSPAAPMVPRSMELLTVDIECNQDLKAICDKFADLKTIQLFNSIHTPLANAIITPILVKHKHLTFLSLYGFEITDEIFQGISGLPSLQKLSLVDAELDNDDCAKIASAVSHVNLELLSVSENRDITMEGIVQLAPLTTIGALNIRGTSVGFGVLDALAESPHLFPKLVVLMVTQLSLIELTRRSPALKVRYIRA